jgi:hypothetical protein
MVVKLATDEQIFGTDFNNSFEIGPNGDFKLTSGLKNAEQRVYNRVMAKLGELEQLGYPDYGNESWTVPGETDREVAESKIKIFTESCLKSEPVVEDIIDIMVSSSDEIVTVEVEVQLIGQTNTSNLVFGLEVS